jgi:hypothetical protein
VAQARKSHVEEKQHFESCNPAAKAFCLYPFDCVSKGVEVFSITELLLPWQFICQPFLMAVAAGVSSGSDTKPDMFAMKVA